MTKPKTSTSYWRGYGRRLRLTRLTLGISEAVLTSMDRLPTPFSHRTGKSRTVE